MARIEPIDFSSKHDILIRNKDGSFTPMDEPYYQAEKIAPGTWCILSDGDRSYLVEGDNEALVIDSGYGAGNIRAFCQTLTEKPVRNIANTHDHFDHTANNCYFEKAYMTAATAELATIPFPSFAGIDFPRDYPKEIVRAGDVIYLGGRSLEIFETPDHAVGSICFLDRKERILFCGDEIMPFMKMINGYVEDIEAQFSELEAVRGEFDWLCSGGGPMQPADAVDKTLKGVRMILAGDMGKKFEGLHFGPHKEDPIPPEYAGRKIYGRQGARPEDRKVDADAKRDAEFKREIDVDGLKVIFDSRKVRRV